ncbi:hypothetical protein ACFE04_026806 [Oxalis oulophora]
MFVWWRDVIRESTLEGHHTKVVQLGLRYGSILFIVSEVMFLFAFFWASSHSALAPTVEIGGIWPPLGIWVLDPWEIPFLNTLILLSSGAAVTWAHHAILAGKEKRAVYALVATVLLALSQPFEINSALLTFLNENYEKLVKSGLLMPRFLASLNVKEATGLLRRLYLEDPSHMPTRDINFIFQPFWTSGVEFTALLRKSIRTLSWKKCSTLPLTTLPRASAQQDYPFGCAKHMERAPPILNLQEERKDLRTLTRGRRKRAYPSITEGFTGLPLNPDRLVLVYLIQEMTAQELRLPPDDFFQSPSFKDLLEWMENVKNMLGSGMVDWERNDTISDLTNFDWGCKRCGKDGTLIKHGRKPYLLPLRLPPLQLFLKKQLWHLYQLADAAQADALSDTTQTSGFDACEESDQPIPRGYPLEKKADRRRAPSHGKSFLSKMTDGYPLAGSDLPQDSIPKLTTRHVTFYLAKKDKNYRCPSVLVGFLPPTKVSQTPYASSRFTNVNRSDPPDDKVNSALLLSRRTYPPRDSWNFCGLRWRKSTKARQIDRLPSRC